MNRKTLALLPIAALALAGCGDTDPDDLTQEQREEIAQDVVSRDFFDCDDDEELDECEDRYERETTAEVEESLGDHNDSSIGDREFTGRMTEDVEPDIGEAVEVDTGVFVEQGDYLGTVALSSVEFSDTCVRDARDGSTYETEAGQFVYLTFDIEADSAAEDTIDFNTNTFRWNDYHYALSTPDSLSCEMDLGHQDPIEPGESGQYTAIWDVPSTEAELQWSDPAYTVTWQIDGEASAEGSDPSDSGTEDTDAAQEEELIYPEDVDDVLPGWPDEGRGVTPDELELLREEDELQRQFQEAGPGGQAQIEERLGEIQDQF